MGDHTPFPVDVRIITATNRDLEDLTCKGKFRKDLFFRINVFPLHCPTLASRKEDIPIIVKNFIERNCTKSKKNILGVTSQVMELLMNYNWPGNVRELRNVIEYTFVLCSEGWIEAKHIPPKLTNKHLNFDVDKPLAPKDQSERDKLLELLRSTRGNQSELARRIGISRVTLWKRIKRYGIRIPEDI